MAPYFKLVLGQSPSILPSSSQASSKALLEKLEAKNKATLEELETKLTEAEKTEGETEISDALRAKANYLTKIGDKVCKGSDGLIELVDPYTLNISAAVRPHQRRL